MLKELPLNTYVKIVNRNPKETIYYEEENILQVVSKTFLPVTYGYKEVEYTLRNVEENTILEQAYSISDLEELPICTICGSAITGDTCQNEKEEIICEECLIQSMAKQKGLIKE